MSNLSQSTANITDTSLIARMAQQFQVDHKKLYGVLCSTCFRPGRDGKAFSQEEVMATLIVAERLGLNPLTREIWAFRTSSGGVQPIVSIDGWKSIMLRQPAFDGYNIRYSESTVEIGGQVLPEYCECEIFRKDLSRPIVERVYMAECHMGRSPVWMKSPRLMLHHRALIQAIRFAFPVTGIADDGIVEMDAYESSERAQAPSVQNASPSKKPMTINSSRRESVAKKAVSLAKQRGFTPAFQFAETLDPESCAYVKQQLLLAQEEMERQKIDDANVVDAVDAEAVVEETADVTSQEEDQVVSMTAFEG